MTNVLQVFGSLGVGGAESRMMDVYRQMDPQECHFDFVSMKDGEQYFEPEIRERGGTIYKIRSPREVGMLTHLKELRACMRAKPYDAVHAHTSYHCGMVMLAAWLEHIPVRIAHARTSNSRQKSIKKIIPLQFGRSLIRLFSTKRIAVSAVAGRYLFGKANFEVLPNAICVENYQKFNEVITNALREELQISLDAITVGHIGRFATMKNHRFVLECFAALLKREPNAVLLLVGDGELRPEMESYAQTLGIDGQVRFLGQRSDVPTLIHTFDVVLFPSLFEGLPGVLLEAQAAGVPVVQSDCLTEEIDMGLGLVTRCSLEADMQHWTDALIRSTKKEPISPETIRLAFDAKGFNLSSVAKKFLSYYRGAV